MKTVYHYLTAIVVAIIGVSCSKIQEGNINVLEEQTINEDAFTKSLSLISDAQSGDIKIVGSRIVVEKEIVYLALDIESSQAADYYLSVFMIPEDSSVYRISANGETIKGLLKPQKVGWQAIRFTDENRRNKTIPLRLGRNEVRVYSSSNDFPEIQVVRMTLSESENAIHTEAYDEYVSKISSGSFYSSTDTKVASLALVDYQYALDCPLLYSFTKTIVLTAGNNQVTVASNSGGNPIVVDIFKDNVYTYKTVIYPANGFTQNFPPGIYTVHLRRYLQNQPSLAPIRISYTGNVNYNYSICPISGYNFETQSDGYNSGQVNYFTCHTTSGSDPVMYLENAYGGAVGSTNDNYSGSGDFDWTVNSRLSVSYSGAPLVHIFNSSSVNPEGTCDLYVRIPYSPVSTWFPNLIQNDALKSGDATGTYNCIAWAGDQVDEWVWPLNENSPYYIAGATALAMFDYYFDSKGYTRFGANASNAAVALWGTNMGFTHASITKNARSVYPHGYDWESKTGASVRLFHERNSLSGSLSIYESYGEIKYYYRVNPEALIYSNHVEHYTFNDESLSVLRELSDGIKGELKVDFLRLFNDWIEECNLPENIIQSNPEMLKRGTHYKTLLDFCMKEQNSILPLIITKLVEGNTLSEFLFLDVFPNQYNYLKESAFHRYQKDQSVRPSARGNALRLAEAYLGIFREQY